MQGVGYPRYTVPFPGEDRILFHDNDSQVAAQALITPAVGTEVSDLNIE